MAFNSDYNTNNSYNVHNAKPLINREQNYVIEAGNLYFRFYTDSGQLQSGGNPVELAL